MVINQFTRVRLFALIAKKGLCKEEIASGVHTARCYLTTTLTEGIRFCNSFRSSFSNLQLSRLRSDNIWKWPSWAKAPGSNLHSVTMRCRSWFASSDWKKLGSMVSLNRRSSLRWAASPLRTEALPELQY